MPHTVTIDEKKLAELFAPWNRTDEPGVVVGVSHPTAGTWRAGFGLASYELPVVNTPRTKMRIGSTSKMFTCLATLLLQEEGKLSIDDPVRKYVPELPDWAEGMTLRHFMTHTSGMRCHIDLMYQTGNFSRPAPADSALTFLARQRSVNFPVGARYSYNNGGYNLLSTIVERLSGQSFVDFQRERIFAPLGMLDTHVKRTDDEMLPNSASLHVKQPDGRFERGYFGVSISGEGAMVSTVEDMLVWLKHMHAPSVGSAETWRQMKSPMKLNNGGSPDYALGLMVSDHRGVQVLHHAGGVMGGVCMCMTVEALGLDVIIIANRGDTPVQPLGFQVIDACVDGLAEVPAVDPGAVEKTPVGVYFCAETAAPLEIKLDDGKPSVKLQGQQIPVRVDDTGALVCTLPVIDFSVTRQQDGTLAVYARGVTDTFRPAAEANDDANAEAARLAGVYRCDEMESAAELRVVDGEPRLTMSGPYGRDHFTLTRFAPLIWTSTLGETGFGGVLEFKAEAGRIVGFDLSTARTTKLPYVRSA